MLTVKRLFVLWHKILTPRDFMPKPIAGINGNGMHVHQSLGKDGKNAFYDAKSKYNGLSNIALQFIAGQLKNMSEIIAVTNPTVNSV